MKKILAFLIIAIMIMSAIPLVTADTPAPVSTSIRPRIIVGDTDDSDDGSTSNGGGGGGGYVRPYVQEEGEDDSEEDSNAERRREMLSAHVNSVTPKFSIWRVEKVVSKNPDASGMIRNLSDEAAKIFMRLPRAEQKRILELAQEQAEEKLGEYYLKAVDKALMYRARTIPVQVMTEARERLQESKENYQEIKKDLDDVKGKFEKAKLEHDEEQATEHAQRYMIKTADLVIKALERVQYNFEVNDDLSEEEVLEVLLEINETIQDMENAKSEVEAAQTKQEVMDAGQVILQSWKRSRLMIKKHAALLINSKIGDTIKRSENLESKLDCTLQSMEEQGIDIDDIESRVVEFSEEVYNAKEKYREAKELLDQAEDSEDETLVESAKALIEEAKAHLENAHEILKQIVRDIKEAGGEIVECDEPELDEDETYVLEEGEEDEENEEDEETELELDNLCEDNGGEWLEEHSECESLTQELCEANGGVFNECASACRHSIELDTICTLQCVMVCEFSA